MRPVASAEDTKNDYEHHVIIYYDAERRRTRVSRGCSGGVQVAIEQEARN